MCGGFTCSKNTLVGLNVVYIMVSFLMIGVAIHGKTSGIITSLPIVGGITACGIFLLFISVVGLIGAVRHHQVMLFFYMVVLFLIFLIQFSVSCAALAINEEDERKIVEQSWGVAYKSNHNSSLILQAEQTFHCCGLKYSDANKTILFQDVRCGEVTDKDGKVCTNGGSCPVCMDKIRDKVDTGFNGAGVVGLIFSFTELIGGIVACRYRNQLDPFAQTPSTPFGSG